MREGGANTSDLRIFCLVGQTGSFSEAAKLIGASRSLVSKRISRLEQRLGTRLVNRSTRSLSLTEAGTTLLARYEDIHERIERAEREVVEIQETHSGIVRIAAPTVYSYIAIPFVSELQEDFPDIDVRISVVDGEIDIIGSGYDAAIHIGDLKSSNLICRKVATSGLAVCGAPAYFEAHRRPETLDDLERHNCLRLESESASGSRWRFRETGGKAIDVAVAGNFSANSELILLSACIAGAGLCQLPTGLIDQHVDAGDLEIVLSDFSDLGSDVFVVLPHRDIPAKVRVVIDRLTHRIAA